MRHLLQHHHQWYRKANILGVICFVLGLTCYPCAFIMTSVDTFLLIKSPVISSVAMVLFSLVQGNPQT